MSTVVESTVYCPGCDSPKCQQTFDCGDSSSQISCPDCGYFGDTDMGTFPTVELRFSDDIESEVDDVDSESTVRSAMDQPAVHVP